MCGAPLRAIALPRGSRPFGIAFRPDGGTVYVTLESGTPLTNIGAPARRGAPEARFGATAVRRELAHLLELDPASGAIRRMLAKAAIGLAIVIFVFVAVGVLMEGPLRGPSHAIDEETGEEILVASWDRWTVARSILPAAVGACSSASRS